MLSLHLQCFMKIPFLVANIKSLSELLGLGFVVGINNGLYKNFVMSLHVREQPLFGAQLLHLSSGQWITLEDTHQYTDSPHLWPWQSDPTTHGSLQQIG